MPPAPSLEDRVQSAPSSGGGSIFDTIGGSIDNLIGTVKSIPGAIKKAAHYTYYTAKLGASLGAMYLLGGTSLLIDASITSGGFIAGKLLGNAKNKEKTTFKQLANEGTVGAVMGGFLSHIFKGAYALSKMASNAYGAGAGLAAKAGSALASMPLFMTTHEYVANPLLINGYKPMPWKEKKKQMLGAASLLGIPVISNFCFVPPAYNMPVAAGISTTYGFMMSKPNKKEEKPEAQQQLQMPPGYQMPQTRAA